MAPCSELLRGIIASMLLALCSTAAWAQNAAADEPSVTPYRPSVSTPAALSAPGWLEVETGLQRDRGAAAARSNGLSYTFKLAFTADWGVRVGGDAWVRQTDENGQRISGGGDTGIVLKRRFAVDETHAFGIELGATLPTGRTGIGSDKSDTSLNGIYSADFGMYHLDANLAATRFGRADPATSRVQVLWAAGVSRPLNERWSATAELSGTRQRGASSTQQVLLAAGYTVSNRLALDVGAARSVRSGVPDWSAFAGLTWLAARLF